MNQDDEKMGESLDTAIGAVQATSFNAAGEFE